MADHNHPSRKANTMTSSTERAVLAGGCFWGMQDLIRKMPGVISTRVGYSGGDVANATYRHHGTHAEAIEIMFDPKIITFRTLLEFFFQIHDPTSRNRQGNDVGTSYRSAIFYLKRVAEDTIADRSLRTLARQGRDGTGARRSLLGGTIFRFTLRAVTAEELGETQRTFADRQSAMTAAKTQNLGDHLPPLPIVGERRDICCNVVCLRPTEAKVHLSVGPDKSVDKSVGIKPEFGTDGHERWCIGYFIALKRLNDMTYGALDFCQSLPPLRIAPIGRSH
jgi:methionine-S-sulfoxide reductase